MRYLLLMPLVLVGCSGESAPDMTIIAPETFVFAAPAGATEDALLSFAREKCEGETHCKVMAWADQSNVPTTMPMLTREVNSMLFSYTLNRTTDYEQVLVDCGVLPTTTDRCLADIDVLE